MAMDDQYDIMKCHDYWIRQINTHLCFSVNWILINLLIGYCFLFYGSVLWNNTCNGYVERVCRAWRVGIRRVWGPPSNAYSVLLP